MKAYYPLKRNNTHYICDPVLNGAVQASHQYI